MNYCLNCEIQGLLVEAVLYYDDKYGSKIPLCAECYTSIQEESFAPMTEYKDE